MVPATRFARHGDLTIAYQEAGAGPAFLLVHGFTGSKLDFQDQLEWFADLRRVIGYDQRGHGESSRQPPYDFSVLSDDLIGLLDALDIARCDLLGHSLGGMVAMRALLAHPDRFRSLVLMDTAPAPVPIWSWRARRKLKRLVGGQGSLALLEETRRVVPTPAQQRGIDFLGEEEHWRRRAIALEQLDPRAFCELMDELKRHRPVLRRLAEIRCPVTLIVGACDAPFLDAAYAMADKVPHAHLTIIPGADHSPQFEQPEAWRAAVRDHLRRVDGQAAD